MRLKRTLLLSKFKKTIVFREAPLAGTLPPDVVDFEKNQYLTVTDLCVTKQSKLGRAR